MMFVFRYKSLLYDIQKRRKLIYNVNIKLYRVPYHSGRPLVSRWNSQTNVGQPGLIHNTK